MFKKAERKQIKAKIAIMGPSGSGKTQSALRFATGMGGKIALIDTENGSASLYADKFNFDVVDLAPPYTVQKYQSAIEAAETAGYATIIIDSITHAWAGEGGLLEQKEQLDARGKGSSFTNWASISKQHESFKNHFLHSNCHIICTVRSKQEYTLVEEKGKQVPKKVGMAPIQREGLEYEFSVVFDVSMNHEVEVSKDRTGLFAGMGFFQITEATGKKLVDWLATGSEYVTPKREPVANQNQATKPPQSNQNQTTKPPESSPPKIAFKANHADIKQSVFCFGSLDGKTLEQVSQKEWCDFVEKALHQLETSGRQAPPWFQAMVEFVDKYFVSLEPRLDETEQIPF